MSLFEYCTNGNALKMKALLPTSDVNEVNPAHGLTVLHIACQLGRADLVELLLKDPRLDPNIRERSEFQSALHIASKWNHPSIVRLLLLDPRVDKKILDEEGRTPYVLAFKNGCQEIIGLLNEGPHDFQTPALILAVVAKDQELLDHLLAKKMIDVNEIYNGASALSTACCQENLPMVRSLLRHPEIDPNVSAVLGETPLHEMALTGKCSAYQIVLDHPKTDACALDYDGRTPLAVACAEGNTDIVFCHLLKKKGTEYKQKTVPENSTPFMQAITRDRLQIVKSLLVHNVASFYNALYAVKCISDGAFVSDEMKAFLDRYEADPVTVLSECLREVQIV